MPLITHLLNVEELSRLLKNVALSVINLFILDDVSEKMEYIPDWVVVTRLNIWYTSQLDCLQHHHNNWLTKPRNY